MFKDKEKLRNIFVIILIIIMCGIIFFYQSKKIGFHEDEVYSIASSVNPYDGLMSPYGDKDTNTIICEKYIFNKNPFIEIKNAITFLFNRSDFNVEMDELYNAEVPIWKTRETVKNYMTLSPDNYLNLKSIFYNQLKDNHPPLFYTLVHFSSIIFSGKFTKYSVFLVNLIAFILSCFVIKNILKLLNKENLIIPILIFYGLSMGTISMVIYQRMYMLLTFFILLYFYYSLKLYKSDFNLDHKLIIKLGFTTVLGFLTQYFFAIYAFLIFIFMIAKMFTQKKYSTIFKYVVFHILYAIIGILLFVPCIEHLLFTDRGIKNLSNSDYFTHFMVYLKHLAYSFSIETTIPSILIVLGLFLFGTIYLLKNNKEKFITLLTVIPSIIYFFIVVKLTSFQELRYIMPVIPFVCIALFFILDSLINIKFKNTILLIISTLLVLNGILFSSPKFLYEDYKESLEIAESNKEKSFVYVYDNFFNHMQSIPEMMIYEKTLIINVNRNELQYVINNDDLNNENSYILCIKSYMDNDKILDEIQNKTDFKNITTLYKASNSSSEMISNNLYLISK